MLFCKFIHIYTVDMFNTIPPPQNRHFLECLSGMHCLVVGVGSERQLSEI